MQNRESDTSFKFYLSPKNGAKDALVVIALSQVGLISKVEGEEYRQFLSLIAAITVVLKDSSPII